MGVMAGQWGFQPQFQRSERCVLCDLDDRPKSWYGHEESNPDLYVRSVPSCPLDDARVKLWQPVLDSNQRLLGQSQESYR